MDDMTIGEIGRSLTRLENSQKEQLEKLDAIKEQTTKTNGRVDRLEDDVRDLKHPRSGTHNLRRAADRKDAMTFTVSRNTIITAAIALGSFAAAMLAAFMGFKLPLP